MKKLTLVFLLLSILGLKSQNQFKDPNLAIDKRIDNLISLLTLDEKIGLLVNENKAIDRLGIPQYDWWNECLHGVARAGKATVFPQAIGMAATFDDDLVYRVATAISDEARAKHNVAEARGNRNQYLGLTFWTPNINIFRDPRWGRGQETYGEDPYLTGRLGASFVKGLQGNDPNYLKVAACAKHLAVHSGPEATRHNFNANPPKRDLYETYLPAFKTLVDANVEAVMCAYNRLYGEPCCSSLFLYDILRNKWGFQGHVVSDCGAVDNIWLRHKVVKTKEEAIALAVKAGMNLECGDNYLSLKSAMDKGLVTEKQINEILRKNLATKFKLGMYDQDNSKNPYAKLGEDVVNCQKHKDLAYEAASKSVVLLKNKNNVLPLDEKKLRMLFVAGPTAFDNSMLVGNYNGFAPNMVTVLEGFINKLSPGIAVDYSMGCLLNTPDVFHGDWAGRNAEAFVLSIGANYLLEGENGDAMLSEHGGDKKFLELPKNQIDYVRKMRKVAKDKPLIVVISGGSSVSVPELDSLADAILYAWYPGEQGGNAIADIVLGKVNPSAKLPLTFYKSTKDLPDFEDYSMANRTYRYFKGDVAYPFGYGLSYTSFKISDLTFDKEKCKENEVVKAKCSVTNTGNLDGDEVVQVYFSKGDSKVERALKTLVNFKRVSLKKGETKQIELEIPASKFAYYNEKIDKFEVEKGKYSIQVATSSLDIAQEKKIEVK